MLVVILAIDMLASFCSTFMFAVAANLPLNFKLYPGEQSRQVMCIP